MEDNRKSLRVLCAGWARTGTHSVKEALQTLGFKCYSMDDMLERGDVSFWNEMANGSPSDLASVTVNQGYDSACGFPCGAFVFDFMETFPDAKVILTVRDEDDWYQSMKETFLAINPDTEEFSVGVKMAMSVGWPAIGFPDLMHNVMTNLQFHGDFSKSNMIRMYRAHNENVRRLVAPENLLVIDITQGHQLSTLIRFLKVPPPRNISDMSPLPHVNTRLEFQRTFITNSSVVGYSAGLLTAGLPYLLWAPTKREIKSSSAVVISQSTNSKNSGLLGFGGALGGWL